MRRVIALVVAAFAVAAIFGLVPPRAASRRAAKTLPPAVRRVGNVEIASVDFENQTLFSSRDR